MIEFSETAQAKLLEVRDMDPARPFLRVFVRGRTCSGYAYGLALDDSASDDDAVFEQGTIRVAIDPLSLQFVDGARIDYVETTEGSGFIVTNERFAEEAEGGCGGSCTCGHGH